VRRIALLLFALAAAALGGDTVRITVLHTNDLHGQLEPLPPSPVRSVLRNRPAGGFAHLATMVRAARREAADAKASLLLLDGGDIFQGTPIGNETRGDAAVDAMNALSYDAGALGNHELDFGLANALRLVERAKHPILAANVSGAHRLRPYVVFAPPKTPCRVAVIGLITPATPRQTLPGATRGLAFADPVPVLRRLRDEIEADLFIVVSHLGRDEELRLAEEVPGIALVCGGHSHTPYVQQVGETLLLQTEGHGVTLARADLDVETYGWRVLRAKGQLLPVDPRATEADPDVREVIERHSKGLDAALKRVVGRLAAPARRSREPGCSSAGNWLADAMREAGEAEIAFMNKGGIRCDLEAGDVTGEDLYRLMPFDNTVVVMDMKGAKVRAIVERSLSGKGPGMEWSGLEVEAEEGGGGLALVRILAGGEPLRDDAVYRVATNSFLAAGGDGYGPFRDAKNSRDTGLRVRDVLLDHIRRASPYAPPSERRLRILKPSR
jgi:5'-nucleotidase/UDP-sugar diphosphatase